jgi:hypothetical protein
MYPIMLLKLYMTAVANNIRIDLEKVDAKDSKELMKMQTKLNQWITTGTLVKFDKDILPDGFILFTICRLKSTGE